MQSDRSSSAGALTHTEPLATVIYDGDCGICQWFANWLHRLDRKRQFQLVTQYDPFVQEQAADLSAEQLHQSIYVLTTSGQRYHTGLAMRYLATRLPLLWPIAVILWIPGMVVPASWAYRLFARNRHHVSRWFGFRQSCAWSPPTSAQAS